MQERREMELMLKGYGLTTAEFLYHLPDHPRLLQSFIWQHYDIAPDFPALYRFIDFWNETLDGPLHSVRYAHQHLIAPSELRCLKGELVMH